jgi:hypothetical protein
VLDLTDSETGNIGGDNGMNRLFCLIAIGLLASNTHGVTAYFGTSIARTLSDEVNFGGCMAQLADPPSGEGLDCIRPWVSFSCTGDFVERDAASRNFEMAQIAQLTERTVFIQVDDARKHNGYCLASKIVLSGPR